MDELAHSIGELTGYGTGAFVFDIHGYAGGVTGTPAGYDPQTAYDWTFLTTSGGITGFSPDMFSLTGDFSSRASINQVGNNLVLHVAPVPEPSRSWVAFAGLVYGGFMLLRRRRRACEPSRSMPPRLP
jgi:hypothetical protein